MEKDIFSYNEYKKYINDRLDDSATGGGHGSRAKLAHAIQCQTSYVTQVLKGSAHFNLEQLELSNDFFGHDELEGQFLLLLLQRERAGLSKLKTRFLKQIEEIRDSRLSLKNRLGVRPVLTVSDQIIYYSSWYYAAIHVMCSQARFTSPKEIADRLNLDVTTVSNALQFLIEAGLIEKKGSTGFRVGKSRIHLGSDSPLISKHHINWRLQGIRALEKNNKQDLHYSSVVTLSENDVAQVRELITKLVQAAKVIIKDSPEEKIQCLALDFFEI